MLIVHVLLVTEKYLGSGLILNDTAEFWGEKRLETAQLSAESCIRKPLTNLNPLEALLCKAFMTLFHCIYNIAVIFCCLTCIDNRCDLHAPTLCTVVCIQHWETHQTAVDTRL